MRLNFSVNGKSCCSFHIWHYGRYTLALILAFTWRYRLLYPMGGRNIYPGEHLGWTALTNIPSIDTSSITTCGTRLGGSPAGLPFMLTRFRALKDHIYTTRVRLFSRLLRMRCRLFFSLLPLLLVLKTIGWRVVRLNDAMNFLHFSPLLSLLGMNL